MSRYRKVDPKIWNDAKFRRLSDSAKLLFFMLLTHPGMTALGAMRATQEGLAAELGWPTSTFKKAFMEVIEQGMAEFDHEACLVALPNFTRYNPPESPNVVKAWVFSKDMLPECHLKSLTLSRAKDLTEGLPEAYTKAFDEALAEGRRKPTRKPKSKTTCNQEQEQEQKEIPRQGGLGPVRGDGTSHPPSTETGNTEQCEVVPLGRAVQ